MARSQHVVIVEDNAPERERYADLAKELGLATTVCASPSEALAALAHRPTDFLLTDLHLTPTATTPEGLAIIAYTHAELPTVTIVAMSSDPNAVLFERAIALGAHHFIKKPLLNADDLAIALDVALERKRSREIPSEQPIFFREELAQLCPEGIVISPEHLRQAENAAKNPEIPVLIYGETGTGKEEIAKLIHRKRMRTEGVIPLVIVNCANLNEQLLESALFGHKRGSFSGAAETTTGYIGEADGGILFLDEIHTLSHKCQQKLLRVLNDGTYQRLGDTKNLVAKFQVLAASTRDLDDEAENFLIDLRMRLTGIEIRLPPLRERLHDMHALILLFLAKHQISTSPAELVKLEKQCCSYYWRGNIRQLFMALNVMAAMARDGEAGSLSTHLPIFKTMLPPGSEPPVREAQDSALPQLLSALRSDILFSDAVAFYEKTLLQRALARHHGNIAQMCQALAMGRSSFELKRKLYKLAPYRNRVKSI